MLISSKAIPRAYWFAYRLSCLAPNRQSAPEVVDHGGNLEQIGIEQIIFIIPNGYTVEPLNIVAETIIPQATYM